MGPEPELLVFTTNNVKFTPVQDLTELNQAFRKQAQPVFENPVSFLGTPKSKKPSPQRAILERCKRLISAGSFKEAEMLINKIDPTEARELTQALLLRGVARAGQGRHQEALTDFDRSLEIGEDDASLRQSRALSLLALGRKKEAEAEFTRAIQHDSKLAQAYVKRGVLRGSLGKFEEAAADFSRFIDLRPDSPIGYRNRALALIKLGRRADAQPDIIRAKKLEKK